MSKKRLEIVFETEGERVLVSSTNKGFASWEIVGLLEIKKQDILDQAMCDGDFKRTVVRQNGTRIEIEREDENPT